MKHRNWAYLLTSIPLFASHMSMAHAVQGITNEDNDFLLEEIIVTAQKRAESIQDVPVAITVFNADLLKETGSIGINDIALRTPGLDFENEADLKLGGIRLRGIGSSVFSAGQDPAVGVYLDEVYLGIGVGARIDYFDVDSVEVLRGPQGTLFGRNAIAGVIHVTSKRPTQDFEAEVAARYGNYDTLRLNATVSGAIIEDKVSARITGFYDKKDGDITNLTLGTKGHGGESYGVRAKILFTPTDTSEFLLSFGYNEAENHPRNLETFAYSTENTTIPDLLQAFGFPLNEDGFDRNVYSNIQSLEELKAWNIALNGSIEFSNMELVSITSYRSHDYYNIGDTEMSPLDWIYDGDPENVNRFSQELRLVSNNDGAFNWIAGIYYFDQHTTNQSYFNFGSDFSDVLGLPEGLVSGSTAIMDVSSYAAFAHINYDITEKLHFTAGARYTHEKKSIDYTQDDQLGLLGGDIQNLLGEDSWNAFTPSFSLQYHWTDAVMTYATVSRGFKSGGFNDALGDANGIAFDPEFLWNYEAGLKSRLLNKRVLFNVAVYNMKWSDIQVKQDNPNTPVYDLIIFNGGKATSKGVEVELTALAARGLELGGNITFQEGKYTAGVDLGGNPLGNFGLPDFTYSTYAKYDFDVGDIGNLSFRLEYLYQDQSLLGLTETALDNQLKTGHKLLNARIALQSLSENWEIALWGKNLTKEVYVEGTNNTLDIELIGQALIELNDPRTYGIELRYKF